MAKTATTPKTDPGLDARMSGDGVVLPTDADGLLAYWQANGESKARKHGMPRADFVSAVRTMIDEDHVTERARRQLALSFPELDD